MAKNLGAVTPGSRFYSDIVRTNLYKGKPIKYLKTKLVKTGGRNNQGRMTNCNIGGGAKRAYRLVDFSRRDYWNIPGIIQRIEYDPNRNAFIALVKYDGVEKLAYVLAWEGVKSGDKIICGDVVPAENGNRSTLSALPLGTFVHDIEITPGKGGQVARAAGCYAQILSRDNESVILRLRSKVVQKFMGNCLASVGIVSNAAFKNTSYGKAGRTRNLGWRPHTRGVAKNPVDHPMGGRTKGGRPPCSPTGLREGIKTRAKYKYSNRTIIRSRHVK